MHHYANYQAHQMIVLYYVASAARYRAASCVLFFDTQKRLSRVQDKHSADSSAISNKSPDAQITTHESHGQYQTPSRAKQSHVTTTRQTQLPHRTAAYHYHGHLQSSAKKTTDLSTARHE